MTREWTRAAETFCLSIKAVNEDSERNAFQQYRAQVKREAKFGTFADLLKKVNVPKE